MKERLLLIGDSIRWSYQPHVTEELADTCEVIGVDMKIACRDTRTTLNLFDDCCANSGATIVHWNNGLHDISRSHEDDEQCRVPLDEYERNLEELFARLNQIAPGRIIWARTTPVIEARHNSVKTFNRFNRDIDAYNAAADAIMAKHNVSVNDLHAVIARDPERYIRDDGVHFNEDGEEAAAKAVVAAVLSQIHAGEG
jgi:lysophospholipase L1-like esterase